MGLPTIDFIFKTKAATAISRSARGVLAIVVQDATKTNFAYKTYGTLLDVESTDYTAANYAAIARAFDAAPYKVTVVRIGTDEDMDDAKAVLATLTFNWICTPVSTLQAGLSTYVKAYNTASKAHKIKAVVCGVTAANDEHIVNVPNTSVTLVDGTELKIELYLPRLGGILAACPMTESVTYRELTDLSGVSEVADLDASIDAGNMPLFQDDTVFRISRGVNTLTTLSGGKTEDMKKITVVEGMDMMREDIITTFKAGYLGKFKNKADNQSLFISAVVGYFKNLAREDVLDPDYANTAGVDVGAQKAAWEIVGTDTSGWDDATAKKRTFKSFMYLEADVKILDAIEDLKFVVNMA
nr:MAG TPA: tail sheath protein [Caudoviricetes sp.]